MLLLILLLQGIRYVLLMSPPADPEFVLRESPSAIHWLDSIQHTASKYLPVYTYNPNYLSDYQGYMLGMSPREIDRIFAYRASGKYINSEAEFWAVTEIVGARRSNIGSRLRFNKDKKWRATEVKKQLPVNQADPKDINKVSAKELRKVRGIGPVLSERIVKFRDRLGGFLVDEQLNDVYGLDRQVADRVLKQYVVLQKPEITPININEASVEQIASLVYINRQVAYRITRYREQYGPIVNLEELTKIEDFPADKIERISLYLSL